MSRKTHMQGLDGQYTVRSMEEAAAGGYKKQLPGEKVDDKIGTC